MRKFEDLSHLISIIALTFGVAGCALLANPVLETEENISGEVDPGSGDDATTAQFALDSITYKYPVAYYVIGESIFDNYPGYEGSTPTAWSITPSLPTGISLNTSTGVISGTPTLSSAATTYTVTATNSLGSQTTTIAITVTAGWKINDFGDTGASGSNSDETCDAGSGECTLRAAIEEASNSGSPPYTLMLPNGRYRVLSAELAVTQDINIMGESEHGVIITPEGNSRAFNISSSPSVTLSDLTIDGGIGAKGGAILITGGALTLDHVTVSNSFSSSTDAGAVKCDDNFDGLPMDCTFRNTTFYNNASTTSAGCVGFSGDTLTIEDSKFIGCRSTGGVQAGAIEIDPDVATTISRTTFYRNVSEGAGWAGAIWVRRSNAVPVLIEDSSFIENDAVTGQGGAILIYDQANTKIRNCTFVRNMHNSGGTVSAYNTAIVTIEHSTFFQNMGGVGAVNGTTGGKIAIQNNVFAQQLNALGDLCSEAGGGGGVVVSGGGNVFSKSTTACNAIGTDTVADPRVLGLGQWGGPVETVALADDSPAIGFGDLSYCSTTDARGFNRGSACDSGAYEFSADIGPTRVSVPRSWYALKLNEAMPAITPTSEGTVESYSILPGLPTGLTLNIETGVISGTPTQKQAAQTYTLYAKNEFGSTSTKFKLKVLKTFNVNSTAQTGATGSVTDGVCDAGGSVCTLNAAIEEAKGMHDATGEEYLIYLPNNTYSFTATIDVDGDMTIVGESEASTIIDPSSSVTALQISQARNLYLSNVTIQLAPKALYLNTAYSGLYAKDVSIKNNSSTLSSGAGLTAGSNIRIDLENTTFDTNSVNNTGLYGGGVIIGGTRSTLDVRNSIFTSNSAENGSGAIRASGGSHLWIDNSYFNDNAAVTDSEGCINSSARLFVTNSAFNNNRATGGSSFALGGSIRLSAANGSIIQSSTFEDNQANQGSAVYDSGTGHLFFLNNTIANSSTADSGYGAITSVGGKTYFFSNLFYNNLDGVFANRDCRTSGTGSVITLGNNMTDRSTGSDCGMGGSDFANQSTINLGSFTTSGTTGYFPLTTGSSAIDASTSPCSARDVLGTKRPIDFLASGTPRCDIGSFEASP